MLKNDYILKNDEYIFKSQAVDSYLSINAAQNISITTYISGITEGTSINVFYKTPTAIIKRTCSNNGSVTFSFNGTTETSYKSIYFCGDLDSVTCVYPYSQYYDGKYTGDFIKFINQFPNLRTISMAVSEFDFNQNISNSEIPSTVRSFALQDCGIAGDITTIKNMGNVSCWCLYNTRNLTGNFHEIDFNGNLECTYLYFSCGLSVNVNTLVDNNPNYNFSTLYYVPATMNASTLDISNLKNIYWYMPYPTATGNFTNWTFNTGLTYFYLNSYAGGNIENWDISDTKISQFNLSTFGSTNVYGDLSGWGLPDTLTYFCLTQLNNVCCLPTDYSNTNLYGICVYYLPKLSGDVTTYIFPTIRNVNLSVNCTSLSGNLENFDFLSGYTSVCMRNSCFTGNFSGITLNPNVTSVCLERNYLTGKLNDLNFGNSLTQLNLYGNNNICLDLNTTFNTKNIVNLCLDSICCVTGSFNNLTVGNNLRGLSLSYTDVYPNLNDLNLNQISSLCFNNSSLSGDITNKFTGTTSIRSLILSSNPLLSGDTTNWNVNAIPTLYLSTTALSGRLKHNAVCTLHIDNTKINSCIDVDWDLSKSAYYIYAYRSCLQGNLSNITLYQCLYSFDVTSNPNLYGATAFANKIFNERKNFCRSYVSLVWRSIGDYVTGTTETLGSLGTWAGHQWDLNETQVNNLAAGLDYDGLGSNTCWDPRQKMYWVKCACVGSGSTTRRYPFYISYSSS